MAGKHFKFEGNGIILFGVRGYLHGKNWALDILWNEKEIGEGYEYILTIISPSDPPAYTAIEKIIANDKAAGRDHLIDHITMSATMAVQLFLEGRIRKTDFMNAKNEGNRLTLKNIEFSGGFYTVVIGSDWDLKGNHYIATIDANGEIV